MKILLLILASIALLSGISFMFVPSNYVFIAFIVFSVSVSAIIPVGIILKKDE